MFFLPSDTSAVLSNCLATIYTELRAGSTRNSGLMRGATMSYILCPLTNRRVGDILLPLKTGGTYVGKNLSAPYCGRSFVSGTFNSYDRIVGSNRWSTQHEERLMAVLHC